MREAIWLVSSFVFTVALLIGGWRDLVRRTIPLYLLPAVLALTVVGFLASEVPLTFCYYAFYLLLASSSVVLGIFRVVSFADSVFLVCISVFVATVPVPIRNFFLMCTIFGATLAFLIWMSSRAVRTLSISGSPGNIWDVMALLLGRLEAEPRLQLRLKSSRHNDGTSVFLQYVESGRTPDGCHVCFDPCPVVTFSSAGWLVGLVGTALAYLFVGAVR